MLGVRPCFFRITLHDFDAAQLKMHGRLRSNFPQKFKAATLKVFREAPH